MWTPPTDVTETDHAYRIRIDLPGLSKDDITLHAQRHRLTIRGKRNPAALDKGERFLRAERVYGGFFRSIPLSVSVDAEAATAEFRDGILTIRIPKVDELTAKTIAIS